MLAKLLLIKPIRFYTNKAFKGLNNKLNKDIKFTKKQKLIKIRDTILKHNKINLNNLMNHQKTLNKWWKDRYLPGETTSWGRKFLKKNIKEGVILIKKRTIENKEQIKILDDKIKELKDSRLC
tara:strand:- start:236 stop:604 length:369 start_codon:yes stop_codon:yes gene_type:complete